MSGKLSVIKVKIHLNKFVRLLSLTFIVPGRKVLSELGDAILIFHVVSPFPRPVIPHFNFTDRAMWMPETNKLRESRTVT